MVEAEEVEGWEGWDALGGQVEVVPLDASMRADAVYVASADDVRYAYVLRTLLRGRRVGVYVLEALDTPWPSR